jgi:deoxycytidine triphosphate deaminase
MSLLNDSRIRYFAQEVNLVTPYDDSQLQPHSIDLRLGTNFKVPKKPSTDIVGYTNVTTKQVGSTQSLHDSSGSWEYNFTYPSYICDEHKGEYDDIDIPEEGVFNLPSLSFVLAHTVEIIKVPLNLVGFACGKSTIARNGLQIEAAGLLDAGFHGQVTLELFNMSPWTLSLRAGMPICQAYFCNADEPMHKFYSKIGHYNGQRGAKTPVYIL